MVAVRHLVGQTRPCVHVEAAPQSGAHDLASCGEDGWVRLWDLRSGKAVRALGEPVRPSSSALRTAVCACHSPVDAHVLFAAWSRSVYAFDLRAGGVILRDVTLSFAGAADAVGSLAVSVDGGALTCGDDSGALHVWDARSGQRQLRVQEAHTSVLSSVLCHPRHALRAFSAGLDGRICAWSLPGGMESSRRKTKPTWVCALLEEAMAGGGGSQQLLNPRLAHAIAIDAPGELLAASLGDGSVQLRGASNGALVAQSAEEDRHSASACQVGFLTRADDASEESGIWSAGNDKLLRIWSVKPGTDTNRKGSAGSVKRGSGRKGMDSAVLTLQPELDVRLPHKPNWVTALRTSTPTLCVADVHSGTLAVYELAG